MVFKKFHRYYSQYTKTLKTHFPLCKKEFMTPLQEYFVTEWFIMTVGAGGLVGDWHTQKQLYVSRTFSWLVHVKTLLDEDFNNFIKPFINHFEKKNHWSTVQTDCTCVTHFRLPDRPHAPFTLSDAQFYAFTPHLH